MKQILTIIAIIVVIVGVVYFLVDTDNGEPELITMAEAEEMAQDWMETEASTYVFDGSNLELVDSRELEENSYEFTFEFESAAAGYGDREDEMAAQVITDHTTVVTVTDGQVVEAITDGVYSELDDQMIEEEAGQEPVDETIEEDDDADEVSETSEEEMMLVVDYLEENISELSPEPEVLGGTFYITEIEFLDDQTGVVEYEDGHIALRAEFEFSIDDEGSVEVTLSEPEEL